MIKRLIVLGLVFCLAPSSVWSMEQVVAAEGLRQKEVIDLSQALLMLCKERWIHSQETLSPENLQSFKDLLAQGADPNSADEKGSALHYVCKDCVLIELLLNKGAQHDVRDDEGFAPLHEAVFQDNKQVCVLLFDHGAQANVQSLDGTTPLHMAAGRGLKDMCVFLIGRGAIVDAQDGSGITPLHLAAAFGHKDVCKLLIDRGASIHVQGGVLDSTALHMAGTEGHEEVIALLVSRGAEVNARGAYGLTSLHLAAFKGHKEACLLLVRLGASVNAQATNGQTPIHAALINGHLELFVLLMDLKAMVVVLPADRTMLDRACHYGFKFLEATLDKLQDLFRRQGQLRRRSSWLLFID